MSDLLVIGYGNELRCDDGAGPRIARTVNDWGIAGVRGIAVADLTPELATVVAEAKAILFVDASCTANVPAVQRIDSDESARLVAHAGGPRELLALTTAVFGRAPPAWLLAVPAFEFGHGDQLTIEAETAANIALGRARNWIDCGADYA